MRTKDQPDVGRTTGAISEESTCSQRFRLASKLLDDYVAKRSQAAFTELVQIYGPMIYGVCRRVVGDHHHAEDAFQATFLVLAQKASGIRNKCVREQLSGITRCRTK